MSLHLQLTVVAVAQDLAQIGGPLVVEARLTFGEVGLH